MKPVGADPDEGIHLIQIWCGDRGESGRCPPSGADAQTQLVPFRFVSGMNCSVRNYNYWADASCQNIENESQLVETRILQYGHYPAPLKNLQSLFMAGSPNTSTFLARQFSVLIAALCIGISVLAARRNYLRIWLFLMILANPFVLSLVASVNPSSWTISSAIGAGILIIGLSLDDFRSGSPVVRLILLMPISLIGLVAAFSRPEIQTLMKAVVLVSGLGLLVKLVVGMKSQLIRLLLIALGLALAIIGLDRQIREWRGYLNFPEVSSSWGGLLLLRDNIFAAPSFALASLLGTPQGGYATALTPSVHFYLLGAIIAMLLLGDRSTSPTFQQVKSILLALLSFFGAVLLTHQIVGQPIGSVIQPRYFTPLAVVLVAMVLRSIPLSISRFTALLVIGVLVFSAFIYTAHNLMRYVAGVSPTHGTQSAWRFVVLSNSTQLWWQDIFTLLSPQSVFLMGWLVFARLAAVGATLIRNGSSAG